MAMETLRDAAATLRDKANDLVTVCNDVDNQLTVGVALGGDAEGHAEALGQAILDDIIPGVRTDIDDAYDALAAIVVDPIVPGT